MLYFVHFFLHRRKLVAKGGKNWLEFSKLEVWLQLDLNRMIERRKKNVQKGKKNFDKCIEFHWLPRRKLGDFSLSKILVTLLFGKLCSCQMDKLNYFNDCDQSADQYIYNSREHTLKLRFTMKPLKCSRHCSHERCENMYTQKVAHLVLLVLFSWIITKHHDFPEVNEHRHYICVTVLLWKCRIMLCLQHFLPLLPLLLFSSLFSVYPIFWMCFIQYSLHDMRDIYPNSLFFSSCTFNFWLRCTVLKKNKKGNRIKRIFFFLGIYRWIIIFNQTNVYSQVLKWIFCCFF